MLCFIFGVMPTWRIIFFKLCSGLCFECNLLTTEVMAEGVSVGVYVCPSASQQRMSASTRCDWRVDTDCLHTNCA